MLIKKEIYENCNKKGLLYLPAVWMAFEHEHFQKFLTIDMRIPAKDVKKLSECVGCQKNFKPLERSCVKIMEYVQAMDERGELKRRVNPNQVHSRPFVKKADAIEFLIGLDESQISQYLIGYKEKPRNNKK